MTPPGCPACGAAKKPSFIEEHRDRIGGKTYRISSCPECGVVFSEPRDAVGADWYEKAAPIRGKEGHASPAADWRFRQFLAERFPPDPGRLLDVGCGDGGFMELAARAGFHPTGFDYDERVVSKARAKGLDAQAMEFSAFCASRQEGEFDYATLFDVLEHTPEPAWFFGSVKKLLKAGGHVALTMPNSRRPLPWGREEHDYPPHHFTRWSPEAMRGFLERQGFEVLRQEAGTLKLRYLSDHFFFYRVMPGLLSIARRVLFGGKAEESGKTITELYSDGEKGGALADKVLRQRLVDAARIAFEIVFAPIAFLMLAYYKAREPLCGDCLYTLARKIR